MEGDDGCLLTPPLAAGALAGVLRQSLIACGRAREGVLRPEDLMRAPRLYVGNALRSLRPAAFAAECVCG